MSKSPCDRVVVAIVMIALAAPFAGCTAIGYTVGSIVDSQARRPVPSNDWGDLNAGRRVRVTTHSGATFDGRLVEIEARRDSIAILVRRATGSPWSSGRSQNDSVIVAGVSSLTVPSTTYRKIGTSLGVVADIVLVMIVRHQLDNSVYLPRFE